MPAFNVHHDSILIFDALVDCLERVVYRKAWERFEECLLIGRDGWIAEVGGLQKAGRDGLTAKEEVSAPVVGKSLAFESQWTSVARGCVSDTSTVGSTTSGKDTLG